MTEATSSPPPPLPPGENLCWIRDNEGNMGIEMEEEEEEEEEGKEEEEEEEEKFIKREGWVVVDGEESVRGNKRQESYRLDSVSLQRTSSLGGSLILITLYLGMEIGKQLSNFTLARRNGSRYPLPSIFLVVLIELGKLSTILTIAQVKGLPIRSSRPSLFFALPAVCYLGTNVLYLYGLTLTSPPIWILLIQSRTLYTAAAYKLIFKQKVTNLQWAGCCLVVVSIVMVRGSQVQNGILPLSVFLLSQLAALMSTTASLTVELLLKNDKRSYLEQQMWLYMFGIAVGLLCFLPPGSIVEIVTKIEKLIQTGESSVAISLFLAIAFSVTTGLAVPLIVKRLDSIVKDYLAALNNLILSVATAILFPEEFILTPIFILSLTTLLLGILLYEKKFLL